MKKNTKWESGETNPKNNGYFYMNETKIINCTKNSMKNTHACTY